MMGCGCLTCWLPRGVAVIWRKGGIGEQRDSVWLMICV